MIAGLLLISCRQEHQESAHTPLAVPPPSVALLEVDGLVLARVLEVDLPVAAEIELVCAGGDETHRWASPEATRHEVALLGLLGAMAYRCDLTTRTGDAVDLTTLDFLTQPLPAGIPAVSLIGQTEPSYVLLNQFWDGIDAVDQRLLIYDSLGRVRWYYELGVDLAGDIDVRWLGEDQILWGGGYGGTPTIMTLLHGVVLVNQPATTGRSYHHHTEITDEGTWLSLVLADNFVDPDVVWTGFAVEERSLASGLAEWVWNTQALLDEGQLPTGAEGDDPYHGNWAERVGDEVRVSLRGTNEILSIDRTDGSLRWRMGHAGDFILYDLEGDLLPSESWFYTQHAPETWDDGMLVYDNGTSRPGETASRIVELGVDWDHRTAVQKWTWTRAGFKEPIWGDVDRLPNGNVQVTIGHCEDCGWIDEEGRSSVLELVPSSGVVRWELRYDDPMVGLYRAERLDPCVIFHNETLCPAG